MQEINRLKHLSEYLPDSILFNSSVFLAQSTYKNGEVSFLAELHHNLEVLLLFVNDLVVLLADVGVFDGLHDVEFIEHLLLFPFVHFTLEDFLIDLRLQVQFWFDLEYFTERTFPDHLYNLIIV